MYCKTEIVMPSWLKIMDTGLSTVVLGPINMGEVCLAVFVPCDVRNRENILVRTAIVTL